MSLEEKIGKLFILPACQDRGEEHLKDLEDLIERFHIHSFLFKAGTVEQQIKLAKRLADVCRDAFFFQDAEWGVGMRLHDVPSLPKNLTLGEIEDPFLLYRVGEEIGRECVYVGAHMNLAPVVDVNGKLINSRIQMRSFGNDPEAVADKAISVMRGMESMGVLTCAKHFPGHGSTPIDTHLDLPHVYKDMSDDLYPFKKMIDAGVDAVMSAHICVPSLAEEEHLPATFSHRIITDLLQRELGFKGLIITDALNMKALTSYFSYEEIAIKAFEAGHDLLLYGDHIAPEIDHILYVQVPRAYEALKAAFQEGRLSIDDLDKRVSKILKAKKLYPNSGKINPLPIKEEIFNQAIKVFGNVNLQEPIAYVEGGDFPVLKQGLGAVDVFTLEEFDVTKLAAYKSIIVSLTKPHHRLWELRELPIHCVVFGPPCHLPSFPLTIIAYEPEEEAQKVVLSKLFP